MSAAAELDLVAFSFFREFARCEYCLKAVGLLLGAPNKPQADWGTFAAEVTAVFDEPQSLEVSDAIQYYLTHPPKKQVFLDGVLSWSDTLPNCRSQAELVLLLVRRVRNNLFHGGKFNSHWFEPQRSEELLRGGLVILRAVVLSHYRVRDAYENRAE
ncbi:hypothetical protein AB4P97_19995 [Pseudomonas sp. A1230]|uniref:hypothetical protein n=1 Tax=Pseudomonas sp. A1230 TaxID=3235106 RepID=UPI0037846EC5